VQVILSVALGAGGSVVQRRGLLRKEVAVMAATKKFDAAAALAELDRINAT
jgi:hypothetical protein